MSKFFERFSEPTTYLGLAQLVLGFGALLKIEEAPAIAHSISTAAEPLATGDYVTGGTLIASGLLGIFMAEKGKN